MLHVMNTFGLVVRERFASVRRRCCTLPIGMTRSFKYNYKPFRIEGRSQRQERDVIKTRTEWEPAFSPLPPGRGFLEFLRINSYGGAAGDSRYKSLLRAHEALIVPTVITFASASGSGWLRGGWTYLGHKTRPATPTGSKLKLFN